MSVDDHKGDAGCRVVMDSRHRLRSKVNSLAQRQIKALRAAMVVGMTSEEAKEYDERQRSLGMLMKISLVGEGSG